MPHSKKKTFGPRVWIHGKKQTVYVDNINGTTLEWTRDDVAIGNHKNDDTAEVYSEARDEWRYGGGTHQAMQSSTGDYRGVGQTTFDGN